MKPDVFLCKSHPDFHIPADVDVGEGFDGLAYARRLKDSGVDAVVFFGKCHYGHSYYYTEVGNRHPRLKMDMLAEVVRGCREADVGIGVYFSVFLDSVAMEKHPDWRLRATRPGVDAGFDSGRYLPVCVNSPYLDELFIPQAREVAANYDVDEIFFDTMTGFRPCYCESCRAKFGEEIPSGPQDANWLKYVERVLGRLRALLPQHGPRRTRGQPRDRRHLQLGMGHPPPHPAAAGDRPPRRRPDSQPHHGHHADALPLQHRPPLRLHDRPLPARPRRLELDHPRDAARDGRRDRRQRRRLLHHRPPAPRRHARGARLHGHAGRLRLAAEAARGTWSGRSRCRRSASSTPTRT